MTLTERQEHILNTVIREYIDLAQPVSSQLLEKKHKFGICPAMIRIEMQKLTDKGFLEQPHTSAGRIPTDKGYRFFVDRIIKEKSLESEESIEDRFGGEFKDIFKLTQSLTKNLTATSSAFCLGYLAKEEILWKEGWEEILQEPEFEEKEYILNFTRFLESFEENIKNFQTDSGIKIFIGRENRFSKAKDFSIISSGYDLPDDEKVILALLGPKRMDYGRNINLINSLTKLIEAV